MESKIKVRVEKPFVNKYSKEVMEEGQILEISENRLKEIEKVSLNLVQIIEDENEETNQEPKE